jgi:MFS family permease
MDSKLLLFPPVQWSYLVSISLLSVLPLVSSAYLLVAISPSFFYLSQDIPEVTETTEGQAVSLFAMAGMLGSLCSNMLSDWLGRKKALGISDLMLVAGTIATISAGNAATLIAGRVLTGLAEGLIISTSAVYIAELTPAKYRGACLSLLTGAWLLSEAVALAVALVVAPLWKVIVSVGALPALIHLFALWKWLPESPRWLVQHNATEQALSDMHLFYPKSAAHIDTFLQSEIEGISEELAACEAKSSLTSMLSLLCTQYLSNFLYTCAYLLLFAASGFAGVTYFSSQIMKIVGFSTDFEANLAAMALFLLGAAASFLNMAIVDRVGRRWILLVFIPFQGLTMLLMALSAYLQVYTTQEVLSKWLSLTALLGFYWFVNLSTAPLSGVVPPELFPVRSI